MSVANRTLSRIPKRAEKQEIEVLHRTFSDSGVFDVIDTVDSQIIYGRRGTGKTHALNYLASEKRESGELAVYLDLRTVGSPTGVTGGPPADRAERATRLLIDILGALHEELLSSALEGATTGDELLVARANAFAQAIARVRVEGTVSRGRTSRQSTSSGSNFAAELSGGFHGGRVTAATIAGETSSNEHREEVNGVETHEIHFGEVSRALRDLTESLATKRLWILIDEWSSLPPELQPFLAEFLLRSVLPLKKIVVKIAAIEHQSVFRTTSGDATIGFEVGADISANVNLDDFMVYEGNEERSVEFFSDLFTRHVAAGEGLVPGIDTSVPSSVITVAFSDSRAFAELVRAAEGVPRDALNIAGIAATHALDTKITVPLVRQAARDWYQSDKLKALESRQEAIRLLHWIIDEVIRGKKARAFLVTEDESHSPEILTLFDARVLHLVRRGYSAQDDPGVRYNIWNIDFGAYVDLIRTKNAPQGALAIGNDDSTFATVDVPAEDRRAIRRAILTLKDFASPR
ncbi:hypothetical protein FVP60_12405 [Microbacterium mitrae]|uniref:Uncharacterized protein n=1 Tax=Microbacterium mitrae TaxID=664640 RepID=A0A5C8HJV2_9MICO|nr:hypothetical protein FVP60_12405 [Microbacterium mitrae]